MSDLYRLLPDELDALVVEMGQPRFRADQVLRALYHESPAAVDDLRQLPALARQELKDRSWQLGAAVEVRRVASDDGQTTKLLLRMSDGILVETVLMQYPEEDGQPRSTVCVSTQAGCAMGCVF